MKFLPKTLGKRCILKPLDVKKVSDGGIDLSAVSMRTQAINADKGVVYMIGENAWEDYEVKPAFKKGTLVYYSKYGARTLQDPENEDNIFILLNDEDMLVGYTE